MDSSQKDGGQPTKEELDRAISACKRPFYVLGASLIIAAATCVVEALRTRGGQTGIALVTIPIALLCFGLFFLALKDADCAWISGREVLGRRRIGCWFHLLFFIVPIALTMISVVSQVVFGSRSAWRPPLLLLLLPLGIIVVFVLDLLTWLQLQRYRKQRF